MEAIANETQNDDDVRHMEQNQSETSFWVAKKATQFQQAQNIIESSVKKTRQISIKDSEEFLLLLLKAAGSKN